MVWADKTQLYGGRYTIEKKLGERRFGITYLARDKQDKRVVIKTLSDALLCSTVPTQNDCNSFLCRMQSSKKSDRATHQTERNVAATIVSIQALRNGNRELPDGSY